MYVLFLPIPSQLGFPDLSSSISVPAVLIGIILGPISAKFLSAERWGSAEEGQQEAITLVSSLVFALYLALGSFLSSLGPLSYRHRRSARYRWFSAPGQVPADQLERDGHLSTSGHDNYVALH